MYRSTQPTKNLKAAGSGKKRSRIHTPSETPGISPPTMTRVRGQSMRPSRMNRYTPPGIATTLNRRFVELTAGRSNPSTLT